MAQRRGGRAKTRILDPDGTARKAAVLTFHRKAAQQRRQAAVVTLLEHLSGMGLEELRRHATTRQWLVALAAATGAENKEVAAIANLSGEVSAHRAKKHPVVQRLIELVRVAQLEQVIRVTQTQTRPQPATPSGWRRDAGTSGDAGCSTRPR
jgi:hypothetical protein